MKKLSLTLNQVYKSFNSNFQYNFEGELILLSGVNGAGKSQLFNIIRGGENVLNGDRPGIRGQQVTNQQDRFYRFY